jgi:ribosomal protein S27E
MISSGGIVMEQIRKYVYVPKTRKREKPYFVPIVAKNKDELIGYLKGFYDFQEMVIKYGSEEIPIDFITLRPLLNSTRFNDVLPNGKMLSVMSEREKDDYAFKEAQKNINRLKYDDNDINILNSEFVLDIECPHCDNYIAFRYFDDIPKKKMKCPECGKILLDYTHVDDDKIDYIELGPTGGELDYES